MVDLLCCRVEGMLQERGEEHPKECWGKNAAFFDAAVYVKWFGYASVILYLPFHVDVKIFNDALQFWWTSYVLCRISL